MVDPTGLNPGGADVPDLRPRDVHGGERSPARAAPPRRPLTVISFTWCTEVTAVALPQAPSRHWRQVWDIDRYVWDVTYDHLLAYVGPRAVVSRDVAVTVAFEEQSVADRPADDKWT